MTTKRFKNKEARYEPQMTHGGRQNVSKTSFTVLVCGS